ncbi:MAG: rhodanese-related sulfurtransferase [Chloroflexi bacterium]|nr:rhodanese-related sulfurtransferase [Chloroflexota bacterium]
MEEPILIAAFYKFVPLPDYREMRGPLLRACHAAGLRGTILLAREGINATIAGTRAAVETMISCLRADPRLGDLMVKESFHNCIPFGRMKVRLKREIVAMKVPGIDPNKQVGAYVEPTDWNRLIAQDDLLLLDARNDYEARMGSFPRSLNPETGAFHELPRFIDDNLDPQRHKRVAMFCTGGIRCEKATAYLLAQGFPEVYHLRGGILNYLATGEPAESLWQGECFVFDERVSLDQRLQKGRIVICDDCKAVVNVNDAECPHCGSGSLL